MAAVLRSVRRETSFADITGDPIFETATLRTRQSAKPHSAKSVPFGFDATRSIARLIFRRQASNLGEARLAFPRSAMSTPSGQPRRSVCAALAFCSDGGWAGAARPRELKT